jgi:hypothetical protein
MRASASRLHEGWMAAAFTALALLQCWPVVTSGERWGFWDWDVFETLCEAGRRTLLDYGQLPGWTPWVKGGEPLDAHPLQPLASPAFLAMLAFGTLPGIKLWVVVRAFAALFGSYLLGRRLGLGQLGAVTLALVFGLASTYPLRVGHGHWNLQAAAYLPLLMHASLGAVEPAAWRARALAAVWLALLFVEGGPYAYAMGALLVGALGAVELARRRWWGVAALALVGALSLGLAAVKLAPVLEAYGGGVRNVVYGTEGFVAGDFYRPSFQVSAAEFLWQALLARDQAGHPGKTFMTFSINVGAYVGWLGLACVAAGVLFGGKVGRVTLLLCLPFLWIALGSTAPLNLWALLHELPVWRSMMLPSKFTACYLLGFAVAAGAGIDGVRRRFATTPARRALLATLVVALGVDLFWVSRPIFAYAFPIEPIAVEPGPFHQLETSPFADELHRRAERHGSLPRRPRRQVYSLSSDLPAVMANVGTLDTYTGQPFRNFAQADEGDTLGLTQLRGAAGEPPRLVFWSPNELRVTVDPARGGWLLVNHNFHRGWTATGDGAPIETRRHRGRLAAVLPEGVREVSFRYRSRSARLGAALSLLSLALVGLAWFWQPRVGAPARS